MSCGEALPLWLVKAVNRADNSLSGAGIDTYFHLLSALKDLSQDIWNYLYIIGYTQDFKIAY